MKPKFRAKPNVTLARSKTTSQAASNDDPEKEPTVTDRDGSGLNTSFQSVEGVQGGISRSFSHTEVQVSSLVTVSYKAKSFRKRLTPNLLVTKRKRNQLDDKGAREQGDTGSDSHDAGERERSASLEQVDTGSDSHDAVENSVSLEQVDTGSDDSVTEERPVPLEPIEFESDCGGECTLSQHEDHTESHIVTVNVSPIEEDPPASISIDDILAQTNQAFDHANEVTVDAMPSVPQHEIVSMEGDMGDKDCESDTPDMDTSQESLASTQHERQASLVADINAEMEAAVEFERSQIDQTSTTPSNTTSTTPSTTPSTTTSTTPSTTTSTTTCTESTNSKAPKKKKSKTLAKPKAKPNTTNVKRRKEEVLPKKKKRGRKRTPKEKLINAAPDYSTMTMAELIGYNPSANPMQSALAKRKRNTSPVDSIAEAPDSPTNGSQATNETPPSPGCHGNHLNGGKRGDCNDRIVPQLKIGEDGNIIVDEQSMVVQNRKKDPEMATENFETVVETDDSFIKATPASFVKRKTRLWTKRETDLFYRALSHVGTDFTLMTLDLPERTRTDIKKKFKKEEKINPGRVNKALKRRVAFAKNSL